MAASVLLEDGRAGSLGGRHPAVSERWVGTALCVVDVVLLVAAALIAWSLADRELSWPVIVVTALGFATFPLFKGVLGIYPGHGFARAQRLQQIALACLFAILVNVAMAFALAVAEEVPAGARIETWPLILICAVIATISDPIARRALIKLDRWCQPIFIFGGGEMASEIVRQLALYPHIGFRAVCIVDDASIYIPDEQQGIPVIRFKELSGHARALAIATTALVVESSVDRSFILRIHTQGLFRRILVVNPFRDLMSLNSTIRRVGGILAIELGAERPPWLLRTFKRAFDVCASAVALVLLLPGMAIIAMLVRSDSQGPILFSQARWAGDDRRFNALKFRTMYVDGERRLRQHFLGNPQAEREYARYRKLDKDPRVTRIGRILRTTSMDELPQLLNVLRGEMSMIGPRPYTIDELNKLGPASEILGLVKPGISGFWQVSGRNQRTFRERIEMDCYYVRNISLALDIWIIYRTVISVLTRDGK